MLRFAGQRAAAFSVHKIIVSDKEAFGGNPRFCRRTPGARNERFRRAVGCMNLGLDVVFAGVGSVATTTTLESTQKSYIDFDGNCLLLNVESMR